MAYQKEGDQYDILIKQGVLWMEEWQWVHYDPATQTEQFTALTNYTPIGQVRRYKSSDSDLLATFQFEIVDELLGIFRPYLNADVTAAMQFDGYYDVVLVHVDPNKTRPFLSGKARFERKVRS